MFQINDPNAGLPASYFVFDRAVRPGARLGTLSSSEGPLPWSRYGLRIMVPGGASQNFTGRTSDDGAILMPPQFDDLTTGMTLRRAACELSFPGDGQHAPTHVRFVCSMP
jgi:hypothetical protein